MVVGGLRRVNMVVVVECVLLLGKGQQVVLLLLLLLTLLLLVLLLLLLLLLLLDEMVVVETLVRVCRVGGGGMQHLALSTLLARLGAAGDRDREDEMEPWNSARLRAGRRQEYSAFGSCTLAHTNSKLKSTLVCYRQAGELAASWTHAGRGN